MANPFLDITPHIGSGLLQVLELSGEEEQTLYVEQAIVVDEGEAMSIAIAAHRHLKLAIDDKQAANQARRTFPEIRLWSTPEILNHWAEAGSVDAAFVRNTLRLIEIRSRYFPQSQMRSRNGGVSRKGVKGVRRLIYGLRMFTSSGMFT